MKNGLSVRRRFGSALGLFSREGLLSLGDSVDRVARDKGHHFVLFVHVLLENQVTPEGSEGVTDVPVDHEKLHDSNDEVSLIHRPNRLAGVSKEGDGNAPSSRDDDVSQSAEDCDRSVLGLRHVR